MGSRRGLVFGLLVLGAAAAGACSEPEIDNELPDVSPPPGNSSGSRRGRSSSSGGLPKPAPNTSSSSGKPAPDGGPEDDGGASGGSSGGIAECDDPDEPNWASDIQNPDYYYVEASDAEGRLEINGVLGDYFDYDTFGIDVERRASPTLFIPNPPPQVQLCAYLLCWSGDPTSFTCDTGTEDEHEGMVGCCGTSTVSMGYSTCSGDGDQVTIYARVTADDVDQQCVDYTIRTSL